MKLSATALTALDAVLGALIGPANLWLMSQLVRTGRIREWLAAAVPWAAHLDERMFWFLFAAPCALATAIAAPLLIRYLLGLKARSAGHYLRSSAAAGIVCGLWVMSFALFLTMIWPTLMAGGAVVAILTALAFAPLTALLCLPAIILSGGLFGLVNALLIRRDPAALKSA